jgi:putative ABC transport system permease protein
MNWIRRVIRRRQLERDLAEEIDAHLAERVDALVAEGLSCEEALGRARREFGNVTLIEEKGRDVWRWAWIEDGWSDVRYALRQLRAAPAFTLATIVTLALGLGANTAVFSVVNAVIRPLPFPEADRLVSIQSVDYRDAPHPTSLSYPTFFDFRRDNRVFEHVVSFRDDQITLTGRGLPLQLGGQIVSWDLFPLLRVQPLLGRGFTPSEEAMGERAVILSHALWTGQFGADPAVVGHAITLDGLPYTVVGVAPAGFNFPVRNRQVQLWTTLARDRASGTVTPITEQRGARMLDAVARLRPGISLSTAEAQLDSVAAALAKTYPGENGNIAKTRLEPALDRVVGAIRRPMFVLFGAVVLVLMIACANVANMLLARTMDRGREFAVRIAIGGSRGRVVRQLLTENFCLAIAGSAAGIATAGAAVRFGLPLATDYVPRAADVHLDLRVLAFAVSLALLTALLFSLPPAMRIARLDFDGSLRERARGAADRHDRVRGTLVVAQIALGLMLSSGATLLVADFVRVMTRDVGFRHDHLVAFNIGLPHARYGTDALVTFVNSLVAQLKNTPAVIDATAAMPLPLVGDEMAISFNIEERPSRPSERPRANIAIVTPGYFRTLGTPIHEGRDFTEDDHDDGAPGVVIVNRAFAARFFPGETALGKRFESGATSSRGSLMREIVGVVGNARQSALGAEPEPIYYLPFRQMPWGPPSILVRTAVPPLTLEPTFRRVVASLDKDVPLYEIRTLEELLASGAAGPRFHVLLMGTFAAMALFLIAAGLYGVLGYSVLRRTREIGVRIALGASRGMVVGMIMSRAMQLVAVGLTLGLLGALAGDTLLRRLLSEQGPETFPILILASTVVAVTAALAAYVPARRAASIDPTRALRAE